MKRFLGILFFIGLFVACIAAASTLYLAAAAPFHPGDTFFPVQQFVENQALMHPTADDKASWYVQITARRTVDLQQRAGTTSQAQAVIAFDDAIMQAATWLAQASPETKAVLQAQIATSLQQAEPVLAAMNTESAPEQAQLLTTQARVSTFLSLLTTQEFTTNSMMQVVGTSSGNGNGSAVPEGSIPTVDPMAVPFPAGSPGDLHAFFPLTGAHGDLDCETCHVGGVYQGTPATCEACHADVTPEGHFSGDCAACHVPTSWTEVIFDHVLANATDCASCHAADKPAGHWDGQCSACHNTTAWLPSNFDHAAAGATDCLSCHTVDKPANHWGGQCSACHSTNAWKPANFDHVAAGATDCLSCHSGNKPANHWGGQCSACHSTNAWKPANFDHAAAGATDCLACHSGNKPAGHFSGQCSTCHSTTAWSPANFNHSGFTDCQSCHTPPAGHYSGQCSTCHSTRNWSFNHANATNCVACHSAPGGDHPSTGGKQCSACHSTSTWEGADDDGGGGGDEGDDDD